MEARLLCRMEKSAREIKILVSCELYMPYSFTFLKRKLEKLYMPLGFENGPNMDALFDLGDQFSSFAETQRDGIKQEARANFLKMHDPPIF